MQSSKTLAALFAAMSFSSFVCAQSPAATPRPLDSQIEIVEELLQIDSQLALEKAREKAAKELPPPPQVVVAPSAPVAMSDVIEVVSVMGIGEGKMATLEINGRSHYRLGVGSLVADYKVVSVGDGCVGLETVQKTRPKAQAKNAAKSKSAAKPPVKKVCFDVQAERDSARAASSLANTTPMAGGAGVAGAGRVAPLPLPTIPAVVPQVGANR